MRRIVNFRSFVYSTLALIITIFLCLVAFNLPWLGAVLIIPVIVVPVVVVLIKRTKIAKYQFVTVIMTALLCVMSVIFFFTTVYLWNPSEISDGNYSVSGTICDNIYVDGVRKVILDDVSLGGAEVPGRIQINVTDKENYFEIVEEGNRLSFDAYVNVRKLIDGLNVRADYIRSDIRYVASADVEDIRIEQGKLSFLRKIDKFAKDKLYDGMGQYYGAIAYGILTGDKNEISFYVRDTFSVAGIAHILAVSGLHIGFLMTVITFILRKFKVKKLPTFIIGAVLLLLYCIFAGFSPSVVRASIMSLIGSFALLLGTQPDELNSLGLASTVILSFSPIMLFESGFIMSVGAVFGLIVFSPILTSALVKIKVPEKAANMLTGPLAAQLGVLPACAFFFGKLQLWAVIVNIVLMPLMGFTFIFLFVSLLLSVIPPFEIFITLVGYPIKLLTIAADFFAALPLSQTDVVSSVVILLSYPLYFVISNFFNVKHKYTVSAVSALIFALIVFVISMW